MVNRTLRNRPHAPHSSTQTAEQTNLPKFLHLPYVRVVSERIERNCRRLGIRTTFKLKGILTEPSLNVAPADCLYIITLLALNLANMLDLAFQARIIFCHIQYIEAILKELEICRQPSMWTQ